MVERAKRPPSIPVSSSLPTPGAEFTHDNDRVTAKLSSGDSVEVLLYGATVISWKSGGRENLFLSDKTPLDGSKAVRGGIPLVFPIFGPPPSSGPASALSQHGFARISRWEFLNKNVTDDSITLDFGLSHANVSADSQKAWPYRFALIYSVRLGKDELETSIEVQNEGQESFDFKVLAHTYFKVEDVEKVTVSGLHERTYIDKANGYQEVVEQQTLVPIPGEVDRLYKAVDTQTPVEVLEHGKPRFHISRDSLQDVVVWNPGPEGAAKMSDFGPSDGWKRMVCVEAGSVAEWQRLDPGEQFSGLQIIKSLH